MKTRLRNTALASLSILALSTTPSSAIVVMISDLVPPGGTNIENFFQDNFTNLTQIRHANWANFAAATTQDALNGTGAYAGTCPANVVVIGRSLSSADYDAFDASGYNGLSIPVVSMTSYTVRQDGDRMGWHGSGATTNQPIAGAESIVTVAGAPIFGLSEGAHDLLAPVAANVNFNGLGGGTTAFGGGEILATVGPDTLAAFWPRSAPGNTVAATVDTFPGPRLLFNVDNEPGTGNDGANDLMNMTPEGLGALRSAIAFATPLEAIPEPSAALLVLASLASLGLLAGRRRR